MRQRILLSRFTPAAVVLAAALIVGACQPPAAKAPAEKPAVDEKAPPAQAESEGPSKAVAQAQPDEPDKGEAPFDRSIKVGKSEPGVFSDDLDIPFTSGSFDVKEGKEPGEEPREKPKPGRDAAPEAKSAPEREPTAGDEPPAAKTGAAGEMDPPAEKTDPPAAKEEDDDEGAFSLKELEASRKLIEKEMAKAAILRAEAQKKRIAELGTPLVDNVDELIRLHKVFPVWTDPQGKRVVMVGEVCQRRVPLEMFACTRHTKEHEAIVVVDSTAQIVHAGLLVVGARPGKPVQFRPKYVPASGQEIEVTLAWKDAKGKKHSARAQDWIRHVRTKKPMEFAWVFAGSGFTKDEFTGKTYYLADGGDFICVSNFATAMLDVPVESSSVEQELAFEAFTERIPEEGTPLTVILTPKRDARPAKSKEAEAGGPSEPQGEKPKR